MQKRANLVARHVPVDRWFEVARSLSRLQARTAAALSGHNWNVAAAYLLDHWMVELTRIAPFPVPMRVQGEELLTQREGDRAGVILTGAHVPFCGLVTRAVLLTRRKADLIVAARSNMTLQGGSYTPAGLSEEIPATLPGVEAFLRARTILRNPASLVLCHLDEKPGGTLSPSLLCLAGRLNARVVLYRAKVLPDGTADVLFHSPPHAFCRSQAEVEENVDFIAAETENVLQHGLT